jgi:phosphomannomutase
VVVGYDRRFLGEQLALEAARTLGVVGLAPVLSHGPVPTPAVSRAVVARQAALGVMLTASHNPPEWNGFKLKGPFGGSADDVFCRRVEAELAAPAPDTGGGPEPERVDLLTPYRQALEQAVDPAVWRRADFLAIADPMHGATGRLLEQVAGLGGLQVQTIRAAPDPLFGGTPPEPTPERLGPLREAIRRTGAVVGLATDGDGDRMAAMDETGAFVSPLTLLPLLVLYLHRERGRRGTLVKTFANTAYLDRIGAVLGLPVRLEPVGFKHVAAWMRREEVLAGGEESGGIGVGGDLPERDGALVSLLVLEMMAWTGRTLLQLTRDLWSEFGELHYRRRDLALAREQAVAVTRRLAAAPPTTLAALPVETVDPRDGTRLHLPRDQWILFRASGTEPLLRIYAEAESPEKVEELVDAGTQLAMRLAREHTRESDDERSGSGAVD